MLLDNSAEARLILLSHINAAKEVILNEDSPIPTRVVDGVLQPVAPTTAEQKLARKNELKARGPTIQNLAFVSSTNTDSTTESVSAAASVSAVCAKLPVTSLLNVDSLSNAITYSLFASQSTNPQLDNEDLKRFLQKTGRNLGANGPTYMGFDMSKVKCYNYHMRGHFARECRSAKDSRRHGSYEWSYQAEEEPVNYALMAFSSSSSFSDTESDCESWPPSSLYNRFQPSGGYHAVPPPYTGTFMPPKPNLVFNTALTVVEADHLTFNDESETKASQIVPSFVQSSKQVKSPRHSIQPVKKSIPAATLKQASLKSASSGKRRNRKACFVCKSIDHLIKDCDYHAKKMAQPTPRNYTHMGDHKQYASLTHTNPQKHMVPVAVLTHSKPVSMAAVRPVSAVMPKINVTQPKHVHPVVTKTKSPMRRNITRSLSLKTSTSPPRVTIVQALVGNPQYALKDKRVIDCEFSRHMIGNMSYLSDFEELNDRYVAFGGNPKGGKISGKGKTKTDLLLPIPFWVEAVNTACYVQNRVLVTKPYNKTPYELLHGRIPSIGFMRPFGCLVTILNTLDPLGKFKGKSFGFTNPQNYDGDAAFDGKEHDFDAKKPESEVILSPSSSAQSRKQDDKTKKEAKGKSPVESLTGYRDLRAEIEDCSNNNSNEVNAAELEDITYSDDDNDVGEEADFNNLETSITEEPKRVHQALKDPSWIEAMVYQMDVKSAFLYGTIKEEVYVCQALEFEHLDHPDKVYIKILELDDERQVPDEFYEGTHFLCGSSIKQNKDGIFISQHKYVAEILRKFGLPEGKSANTPIDTEKPLLKDLDYEDVDVHTYSTTESVSAAASVSDVCAKMHVSSLPNVDSLTEEEPANYALMAFSFSSSSYDNEVLSCSKASSKAYAQLHSQYDKLTADFRKSQFGVISDQTGLESVEARLLIYKQNESVFEENIKLLNIEGQLRDNALVTLRQKLEKAEQERDDLKLKTMSSPDHSTSNNEDEFSSNILDYVSTIPDYSPASSGKTYSNASNNPIVFSRSKCVKEDRVTFATGTLTNDVLSWWNAYAQPIGIEQANKIAWTELKRLITNKRFQELAQLCPNMVPNSKKLIEVFIEGLPRSIEGNVTASKPQTLEEVITITQRLVEQVIKHQYAQEVDDHKRKFENRKNTTGNYNNRSNNHNNNNFQDNHNNNNRNHNYHHQQNKRQEAIRVYDVNLTKDSWFATKWATRPSTAKNKRPAYNQYP
uniref:Reverse transcriptase domain-containing protein n=1 Tax=Tanacetum cinerariifolium TaxID=118510 RepID=A0A6L2NWY5_TANCI|nr:reverse transcriptase domain-containing protein [Tanacetum cinerariifolium]